MTDMGLMEYFLGLEVKQGEKGIFVSQERYAEEILNKFKMKNCNGFNPNGTVYKTLEV